MPCQSEQDWEPAVTMGMSFRRMVGVVLFATTVVASAVPAFAQSSFDDIVQSKTLRCGVQRN